MKPNLWTFGDSLTEGFTNNEDWSRDYIEFKGYKPKVYGEIISEKLDLNLKNLGKGGSDNYSIFQSFCDVSAEVGKNDFLIFGWSSPLRFRLVDNTSNWLSIIPNFKYTSSQFYKISQNTIDEILVNRNNYKFCEEVNNWIKLINNFLNQNKIVHWTSFNKNLNAHYITNLENIEMDTQSQIKDKHFSEKGQLQLSEILLKIDTKNKNLL